MPRVSGDGPLAPATRHASGFRASRRRGQVTAARLATYEDVRALPEHLVGDILVPDLAGWRRERLPSLPKSSWFDLAPDWVCEILAPSTAAIDRAVKMPIYARKRV